MALCGWETLDVAAAAARSYARLANSALVRPVYIYKYKYILCCIIYAAMSLNPCKPHICIVRASMRYTHTDRLQAFFVRYKYIHCLWPLCGCIRVIEIKQEKYWAVDIEFTELLHIRLWPSGEALSVYLLAYALYCARTTALHIFASKYRNGNSQRLSARSFYVFFYVYKTNKRQSRLENSAATLSPSNW